MNYGLVWFKRDLRWHDHLPLRQACQQGPVRCIYILEPELWLQPDAALQHFEFIRESLLDLDACLRMHGGHLEIHHGEATDVLNRIWHEAPFAGIFPTKKQAMASPMHGTSKWGNGANHMASAGMSLPSLVWSEV